MMFRDRVVTHMRDIMPSARARRCIELIDYWRSIQRICEEQLDGYQARNARQTKNVDRCQKELKYACETADFLEMLLNGEQL